jgi:hypothetical protein
VTIKTVRFEVGDRIRVRISTPFVHTGTLGTIEQVYRPVADAYTIQFDQVSHHWVMRAASRDDCAVRVRSQRGTHTTNTI